MTKLVMERKASENKYLHRDFFISADIGVEYVGERFGRNGVIEYLTRYSRSFYTVLAEKVRKNGLKEIDAYLKDVYAKEERPEYLKTRLTAAALEVTVEKCPALEYMKKTGHKPSQWFDETTRTVYGALAEMCGLDFQLIAYDGETGKASFAFVKKTQTEK